MALQAAPKRPDAYARSRELRSAGSSLNVIAREVGVAYSTVHRWTKDVRPDLQRSSDVTDRIRTARRDATAIVAAEVPRGRCGTPGCAADSCDIPPGHCHCRCGEFAP